MTYTVNMYFTTCTLLVNGKNTEAFINRDIKEIHKYIETTTHGNIRINTGQLNEIMRQQLEQALNQLTNKNWKDERKMTILRT